MADMTEIRWHGRGGQGVVTASKVVAEAALSAGKYIQAFPEYGPERMGAPIRSFTRIGEKPIRIHSQVTNPGIVVVLDPTLLGVVDLIEGLPDNGIFLMNTPKAPREIRTALNYSKGRVFTVNATQIALDKFGRNIPNTPMVGALVKASGVIALGHVIEDFKNRYAGKFKKEIVEGNIQAIETAYNEVTGE
ncbi:MAG: 2-oxoacid:acceptor oxidoreductase family protein [Candidatus Omnitrophica bacterium]|nr:2-oxoacid:acceptor oxidoreductase family protein [Candidatus Omnitrophota bacterium]